MKIDIEMMVSIRQLPLDMIFIILLIMKHFLWWVGSGAQPPTTFSILFYCLLSNSSYTKVIDSI